MINAVFDAAEVWELSQSILCGLFTVLLLRSGSWHSGRMRQNRQTRRHLNKGGGLKNSNR